VSCHTAEGSEMIQVFHSIDAFLNSTTHEVLIVELSHIYNADDSQMLELAQMMNSFLGHHMAPCCR
jgi:ADP-glucose pyrophosphorylase